MGRIKGRVMPARQIGTSGVSDEGHFEDNEKFFWGTDKDFEIFHDGTLMNFTGDFARFGSDSSTHSLGASGDLLISGKLEVNGTTFFDAAVNYGDAFSNLIGGGADSGFRWATDQTNHSLIWFTDVGTAATSGNIIFTHKDNRIKDHALATSTEPAISIWSANDPESGGNEYIMFKHDATNGIINIGSGALNLNTGLIVKRTATATDYTTLVSDYIVGVTDTSIARTVTLETDSVASGRWVVVKDESGAAGTNNITIDTEGAETIDGNASLDITANYGVARLYSDGTNWFTY